MDNLTGLHHALIAVSFYHIAQARALGWRGSILGAIGVDHG